MTAHSRVMAAVFRRVLGTWLLFLLATTSMAAVDLTRQVDFNVQPQALTSAIIDFSRQADVQVMASGTKLNGVSTKGVRGRYSIEQGLRALLDGTGMGFRVAGERTIALTPGSVAASEAGSVAGSVAGAASAASPPGNPSRDERGIHRAESIMVTAQKREQRLVDVPLSVGVVTREDIERRGLFNAGDYLRGMPGANQLEGAGGQTITIRGMEANTAFQGFRGGETTGTYFGETPTIGAAGMLGSNIDIKLVDIERVEVLRGPQGTAFGAASMGGAVRIIPVAPRLDAFEGKVAGGYSVTSGYGGDNYNAEAVVNVPILKDQLALRAVHYRNQESGYYRNRAGSDAAFRAAAAPYRVADTFLLDADDIGVYYVRGSRVSALWRPLSDLRLTLGYLTQRNETDGIPISTSGPYQQSVLRVAPGDEYRGQLFGILDWKIDISSATLEYDLGWADLVATYSRVKGRSFYMRPYTSIGLNLPVSQVNDTPHKGDIGEVRVSTKFDGRWTFLAGLFAEKSDDTYLIDTHWFGDPATNAPVRSVLGATLDTRTLDQKAAFGEASWEFIPRWTLTGGVRAFRYEKTSRRDFSYQYVTSPPPVLGEVSDSGATFRANLSYKPADDALAYALFSQGFRVGGAQAGLPDTCDLDGDGIIDGSAVPLALTRKIDSDEVENYELGAKFIGLDRRLIFNAAIYRMNWRGLPVSQLVGNASIPGCRIVGFSVNAGKVRSDGIEVQANFQATRALRIDVGASYIDARLTEDVPAQGFRAGNRTPGTPRLNANLGLQYDFPIAGYRASVRADAIYVGEFFGDLLNSPVTKAGDYVKVDVSARVMINKFNVDFFVKNLTNEDAFTFRGPYNFVTATYGYQMRPRTVGVQVGYAF